MYDLGVSLLIGIASVVALSAIFYFGLKPITRWAAALYESVRFGRLLDGCSDIAEAAGNGK